MDEQISQYYDMINAQQQANNAWSAEQAQKAMDYQERMSNTAHQREVADLKAAGLNPVLSAGGSGASTTSGVAAQAGNENVSALYGLVSKVIDQNIEQAKAMQTSAKAASGSGSYNPVPADSVADPDRWSDNSFVNALQDVLYRKLGIKQENSDKVIDFIQDSKPAYDRFLDRLAGNIAPVVKSFEDAVAEEWNRTIYWTQKGFDQYQTAAAKVLNLFKDFSEKVSNTNYKAQNTGTAGRGGSGAGNRRMVTK